VLPHTDAGAARGGKAGGDKPVNDIGAAECVRVLDDEELRATDLKHEERKVWNRISECLVAVMIDRSERD
jgi:hypothetical protein